MQEDIITLAVDELNDDTTVNHVFNRFEEYSNRSVYTEDNHQLTSKDLLTLYRTFPKPSGNFKGTAKSTFKFSKDYQVLGVDGVALLTSPLIVEVSFSVPVGVSAADQLIGRQKAISLLDYDDLMTKLMGQLMV
jgi:hypothetical protein